jgi:hypothetical protein
MIGQGLAPHITGEDDAGPQEGPLAERSFCIKEDFSAGLSKGSVITTFGAGLELEIAGVEQPEVPEELELP